MKSGVAALDGKLYVVGGCLQTLESCYRTEVFDPITRWKKSSTGSYDQCCGAGPFLTGSGFFSPAPAPAPITEGFQSLN